MRVGPGSEVRSRDSSGSRFPLRDSRVDGRGFFGQLRLGYKREPSNGKGLLSEQFSR